MEWQIVYFSEALQQTILALPAGVRARFIHLTQRMRAFGPNLGMPHIRTLGSGQFEMRMKSKEGIARVFFCTLSGERVMMLHAFVKKSQKIPAKDLRIARSRMKKVQTDADA